MQSPQTSSESTTKPDRNAPWWIKAFVAFHILAITIFALPNPPQAYYNGDLKLGIDENSPGGVIGSTARLLTDGLSVWKVNYGRPSFFKYYTFTTGFWQYWDMFSPNPVNYDLYVTADITYADGSTKTYHYPRMADLDLLSRYPAERYRKFYERVNDSRFMWPAFARRIAMLSTKSPSNPVVQVKLWSHRMEIPPPDQPLPTTYVDSNYFRAELRDNTWHYFANSSGTWQEMRDNG